MTDLKRIPVSGPSITQREIDYVADAAAHGWYENANVYHTRFEEAFAARVRRRHAVALPSCTSAIHLALLALGIGPGDEVIVPESTWIASAAPVDYVGATPVFADVDPDTWCLSAESAAKLVTPKTRAMIPVDLYGGMPDMDALEQLASAAGIAIVEDAAEAVGAEYRQRPAGSFGRASVFSFHGSKTLTTGEGGMLVTDDDELLARVNVLRDHGRRPGDVSFFNHEIGQKYKMSAMQAALGLAQLERLDELTARKREIFGWYRARLSDVPGLVLNAEPLDVRQVYWMVTVVPDRRFGIGKRELIERLGERAIDARPFFYPLSSLPPYASRPQASGAAQRNPVAYRLSETGVNLPSGLNLTEALVDRVCAALEDSLR
jgi:perosamine synthetase